LPVTASALSWPDCTCPSTAETVSNSTSTCLPSTAEIASGEVRNGTCKMLTPAVSRNKLAGEVLRGAEARAGKRDLAGIGLGGGDQLLDVVGGEVRGA